MEGYCHQEAELLAGDESNGHGAESQRFPVNPTRPHLLQILIVISFLHPLLQQGPQLTHVLQTELQSLKAADSCLAEHLP